MTRIIIDAERCQGHARCSSLVPELFDVDDHGLAFALEDPVPPDLEPLLREAQYTCPARAISYT